MRRALALLALALAGCGDRRGDEATWRWIEEPPLYGISAADLREVDCVERYELAGGALPEGLRLVEGAIVPRPGAGVSVRGGWVAPRLAFDRRFSSRETKAMRLALGGLRVGGVRAIWSSPDGGARGEIKVDRTAGSGALRDHFFVDLSGAASVGESFRLELEPTTAAGEIVALSEVCVGAVGPVERRLEQAAKVPWKVTLEGDTRDALLVPPAGSIRRSGRVPRRARLELGVGRLAGTAPVARLTVALRRAGEEERIVLERELAAADLAAGWLDLAADLPEGAAGEAELALELAAEGAGADLALAVSAPRVRSLARHAERPNIVLVSIDTLRADHLSLYGYARPTSPGLDAWARQRAAVFQRVVAPSAWTLPSHFSLFTGIDGFAHPANHSSIAIDASAYRFLAEELWRAGYATRAWAGGAYVAPDYGFARGFEGFRWWVRKELRESELETHAAQVDRYLDGAPEEPFFLFLHTYEVHTPNFPREPWFTRFHGRPDERVVDLGVPDRPRPEDGFLGTGHFVARRRQGGEPERLGASDLALVRDTYDSNIAYTDSLLAPLLERLARPPFAGRTVVAVVSDHGESLGEEGRAGHHFLSLDNLLVPLVLALPDGLGRGRTVAPQVRLHDLHATLLELAGVELPEESRKRSLLPLLRGAREPGRLAFSYDAVTNYGMGLITPDGLKLEWRNSPWRALAGQLGWFRVEGFAERRLAAPPPAAESERWTRTLREAYASQAPGLRVELAHGAGEAVDFELVTDLVDPVSVKAVDVDGPPLDWVDVGRLAGQVPAGRPLRLHFERFARRELSLALAARFAGCAEPGRVEIASSAAELGRPQAWRLAPAGCADGRSRPPLELRLQWLGPVPTSAWRPADRRLEEDLRALGYLN